MTRNERFLLRHAESVGNATGNDDTSDHGRLSERGKRQAREVRDPLCEMDFGRIAVSAVTIADEGVVADRWVSFSNLDPRSGALERYGSR